MTPLLEAIYLDQDFEAFLLEDPEDLCTYLDEFNIDELFSLWSSMSSDRFVIWSYIQFRIHLYSIRFFA